MRAEELYVNRRLKSKSGLRLVRKAASEVACQVETDKALDTVVKERARNQRTQRFRCTCGMRCGG